MSAESISFGLARMYLRELVNALWAQNLNARAYHDMKRFAEQFGDVPNGLLPKYVRGLMDALGPKEGLAFVEKALKTAPQISKALVARLQIEHALLLYNMSQHKVGLKVAARVQKSIHVLSDRERCRLAIYWALLQPGMATPAAVKYLDIAQKIADSHHFLDELGMIQANRAIIEVDSGRPERALRIIATSLRWATRERLVHRQYQLYAQAASANSELGDNRRANKYREKTVWMAQYLGNKSLLASSCWRVALY
jgi:hypothetical protein